MNRPGVFLLLRGWDASPSQGYPQLQIRLYPFIYTRMNRGIVRVKFLAQEHNAGPKPKFQNKTRRAVARFLALKPGHFVSLSDRFILVMSKLLNRRS